MQPNLGPLAHSTCKRGGLTCPQSLSRCQAAGTLPTWGAPWDELGEQQWEFKNYRNRSANRHGRWSSEGSRSSFLNQGDADTGPDQKVSMITKLQAVFLAPNGLANKRPHLHIFTNSCAIA